MFSPITNEQIDAVEPIFLPVGKIFGEEARNVIKCLESVDVNACPGSGKTTIMLAKLLILSSQLPLAGNKGICVLTHTNIAIDEIKERLGLPDHSIFKYPNHFGTIQSFVNKFLGMPGYAAKYLGKRPVSIDQNWYYASLERRYNNWNGAGKMWVSNQPNPVGTLGSFHFTNDFSVITKSNGSAIFQTNGPAYNQIFAFRMALLRDGILSYEDAYVFAEYYLTTHPHVANLIRQRFPLLIIDEMQDTDDHQLSVLNRTFGTDTILIQRIGDLNQSIFKKVTQHVIWAIGGNELPLTGSNRFSSAIASQIDKISITPRNMNGNPDVANIRPKILLYNQANIEQVISAFGNYIIELGITDLSKNPCKAIGWVRETEASPGEVKNCILSYCPTYQAVNKTNTEDYNSLSEYLGKPSDDILEKKGTVYYYERLILVFQKILALGDVMENGRPYSKTLLKSRIKQNRGFNQVFSIKMVGWIKEIQNIQSVTPDVRQFCLDTFMPLFAVAPSVPITEFLTDVQLPAPAAEGGPVQNTNEVTHTYNGADLVHANKQVKIKISTIHGVKGETHAATLYMETFYFADDIHRILQWFKIGNGVPAAVTAARKIESIKMAYVAMSRPEHLLCVALRNDEITPADIQALNAAGWQVDQSLV